MELLNTFLISKQIAKEARRVSYFTNHFAGCKKDKRIEQLINYD